MRAGFWTGRFRAYLVALAGVALLGACEPVPGQGPVASDQPLPITSPYGNPATLVADGERALAARQFGQARDLFTRAMRAQPGNPFAAVGLAETNLALGDPASAEQLLAMVARSADGRLRARFAQGRGLAALMANRMAIAKDHLSQAVATDRGLWRSWLGLGRAHAALGETTAALSAFVQAEQMAPSVPSVRNDIGMFFLASKLPDQAIPHFEQALALDPGHVLARGNLRIARAMAGQYDAAIAGADAGELADALNNAGYAAVLNGDLDVADALLRRALEVSPTYHRSATANLDLLAQVQQSGSTRYAQARPRTSGPSYAYAGNAAYAGATASGSPTPAPVPLQQQSAVPRSATNQQPARQFAELAWQTTGSGTTVGPLPGIRALFPGAYQ